jgi:hypothetical protein
MKAIKLKDIYLKDTFSKVITFPSKKKAKEWLTEHAGIFANDFEIVSYQGES